MSNEPPGATPDGARGTRALPEPSFSRTAIVGASWLAFVPLHFLISFLIPSHLIPSHNWFFDMLAFFQALLFWTAPVGVTILGWVAVSQIRRSTGKLYGLWLAVFDGLLFPLLALDGLIIGTFYLGLLLADQELKRFHAAPIGIPLVLLIPIVLGVVALADFFIIRRVWRAVNKGGAGVPPAEPGVAPGSAPAKSANEPARKSSTGKIIAIGCGVLMAGGFLVLLLLAGLFIGFRHHSIVDYQAVTARPAINANLSFGPVMERVLTNYTAIDVGSGQMKVLPESLTKLSRSNEKDLAVCAWLEQDNTDFAFLGDDGIYGMTRDIKTLKRGEWDSYNPENFVESLHDLGRNVAAKFGNAESLDR